MFVTKKEILEVVSTKNFKGVIDAWPRCWCQRYNEEEIRFIIGLFRAMIDIWVIDLPGVVFLKKNTTRQ